MQEVVLIHGENNNLKKDQNFKKYLFLLLYNFKQTFAYRFFINQYKLKVKVELIHGFDHHYEEHIVLDDKVKRSKKIKAHNFQI